MFPTLTMCILRTGSYASVHKITNLFKLNVIHELKTNNEIAFITLSSRVGQERKCHRFKTVKLKAIKRLVVYKRYPITYLLMQGRCAICNNFKI